jgi:hypothetical protein
MINMSRRKREVDNNNDIGSNKKPQNAGLDLYLPEDKPQLNNNLGKITVIKQQPIIE